MGATEDARALITEFSRRTGSSLWIHIPRGAVATEMGRRLDNPNLIDSSLVNLCGPAAFFRSLVLDSPVAYARAGVSLYEQRQCRIGTLDIRTSSYLWTSSPPAGMTGVDWMMLASLRNSANTLVRYESADDGFSGITMPGGLAGWFEAAGYSSVINETNVLLNKDEAHIRRAGALHARGYRVCLFINAQMLRASSHASRSFTPDHWVVLDSPVQIDGSSQVRIRVFSWGRIMPVPERGSLSVDNFLRNYYGFVAAKFRG